MLDEPDLPAKELTRLLLSQSRVSITWLNHFSIQKVDWKSLVDADLIAFDGTLIQLFLAASGKKVVRTSADLVAPHILCSHEVLTVALVGGTEDNSKKASIKISKPIFRANGFDGLSEIIGEPEKLKEFDPDILFLGLGTPLQDQILSRFAKDKTVRRILTCGGWIDQFSKSDQYFPTWVHKFRLGWLLRIIREPKRLLRRYTLDAINFVCSWPTLHSQIDIRTSHDWTRFGLVKTNSSLSHAILESRNNDYLS